VTRWLRQVAGLLVVLVALWGCTAGPTWPWAADTAIQPTATPTPTPTATPAPTATQPMDLRIWVAASLGPEARPDAWKVLTRARDEFALRHGLTVEVRVKPDHGAGGLVDALIWARAAAPAAAPDLILAPVEVLEDARVKAGLPGLPEPLHTTILTNDAGFAFARQAVLEHGQPFAYPVAAEAPVLAWPRPAEAELPTTWAQWAESPLPWTWAARDPWAWGAWALYTAADGQVGPTTQPQLLATDTLADMLEFLVQARWNGALRSDARLWHDMRALWSVHQHDDIGMIVWSSSVLAQPTDWTWAPLPGPDKPGPLLMRVYAWAVTTDDPARRQVALDWLQRVTAPGWNGPWARAAGLWPTSSAALRQGWEPAQASAWEPWLQAARPAPPWTARAAASQALRAAVLRVLAGTHTPLDAAYQAAVDLGAAEPRPTPTPAEP